MLREVEGICFEAKHLWLISREPEDDFFLAKTGIDAVCTALIAQSELIKKLELKISRFTREMDSINNISGNVLLCREAD